MTKPLCSKPTCDKHAYRRDLCSAHYRWSLRHVPGFRRGPGRERSDDLLSEASITGRIHARRGGRCAVDTAARLFGERVARAYEAGYHREIARVSAA
jgi:hypothetical protein